MIPWLKQMCWHKQLNNVVRRVIIVLKHVHNQIVNYVTNDLIKSEICIDIVMKRFCVMLQSCAT